MAGRSPLRFLAPIALVAFAVALYAVVDGAGRPAGTAASSSTPTQTATPHGAKGSVKHRHKRRTYVVKPGDTASAIAAKTGVSLATMERLNKHFDPQTLSPGQRIRLSE
jgi:LysM repeat protein